MNISNENVGEYYKELTIEIGFLQEAIKLPTLPKGPLTLAALESGPYNLMQDCYKDEVGKFYIPSLFPLVDKGDGPEEFIYSAPKTNKTNGTLKPIKKYTEVNYVELVIPKYIVYQFRDVIPKDTIFLIGFNGEDREISNLNVIGIYGAGITINKKSVEEEDG